MKFTIDTENKTIKILEDISLSELVTQLDCVFSNRGWMEYSLISSDLSINLSEAFNMPYVKPPFNPYCKPNPSISDNISYTANLETYD